MKRKRQLKLVLPKEPTIGSLAEPVGTYLCRVAELFGSVIKDKAICHKDKKWAREQVIHLLHVVNNLSLITALEGVRRKLGWKVKKLRKDLIKR